MPNKFEPSEYAIIPVKAPLSTPPINVAAPVAKLNEYNPSRLAIEESNTPNKVFPTNTILPCNNGKSITGLSAAVPTRVRSAVEGLMV
jgi:hypothetical protein